MKPNMIPTAKHKAKFALLTFMLTCSFIVWQVTSYAKIVDAAVPTSLDGEAIVRCQPAEISMPIRESISIDLYVEGVTDLYGLDLRTSFDPSALQVVDAAPEPGIQIELLNNFLVPEFLLINLADNEEGTIAYAATQLNPRPPVSGSGSVARIIFTGVTTGTVEMPFTQAQLATRTGITIPTVTETCQITILEEETCPVRDEVWIDDDYASDKENDGHSWGCDAFATIQAGLDTVTEGGTVHVHEGEYVETLTLAKDVELAGLPGPLPILNVGNGVAFDIQNATIIIKGLNFRNAQTIFAIDGGQVQAYANNFSNFLTAVTSQNNGVLVGKFNWWGRAYDRPGELGLENWQARLGAPIQTWAEGNGDVSLTSSPGNKARLAGGTGTAVIIDYGAAETALQAPFNNNFFGVVEQVCSNFFDFFTIDASGIWQAQIPVDGLSNNACEDVLAETAVFWIPTGTDYQTACQPPDNPNCWQKLSQNRVQTVEHVIQIDDLTVAELGGTPFVADAPSHYPTTSNMLWLPIINSQ